EITISIDDLSRVYGEADPALTYSVSGEPASGDDFTVALSREAGDNVGDYAITGDVGGDVMNDNYLVSVEDGVLTITP
ncbi:MBG domain-containing protein, partial [Gilvimarinus sp. 1_MG-2023]|uniref:MBG domain-containing protein n=1 Tax=Gilvimarinus sp. 1_MG-2023 TaxID=3062638 RepID=UPI0026E1C9A2